MDITFDKYQKRGAYHWKEYKRNTAYRKNALKIKEWVRPGRTLDIGAGDGLITSLLGAVGIDDNKVAVNLARERKANVVYGDAYNLPFDVGEFDNVIMADVIEHLKHPEKALEEINRVLNDNGHLYIITPPKGGKMDKYHYREYSPEELIDFMKEMGFSSYADIDVRDDLKRMYGEFVLSK